MELTSSLTFSFSYQKKEEKLKIGKRRVLERLLTKRYDTLVFESRFVFYLTCHIQLVESRKRILWDEGNF